MRFLIAFVPLLGVLGAAVAPARPQTPAVRVSVDRVNVSVIVTNSQGQFVEGLSRSQFHVFDNGVEQSVTDFATIDEPANVLLLIEAGPAVYLLESSHLQAAVALLQGLAPADRVAIVKYSDAPEAILDFTLDKQVAASALSDLHYNLGFASLNLSSSLTKILDSLRNATSSQKKTIVLLSTGVDTSPSNESLAILTRLRTGDVRLFAVSLAGALRASPKDKKKPSSAKSPLLDQQFAEADRFLRALADSTGGRAYFPVTAADFRAAYAELAQLIRHEYSLAFAPQANDGAIHTIRVAVDSPASSPQAIFRVDHRQAYQAAPAASTEHP